MRKAMYALAMAGGLLAAAGGPALGILLVVTAVLPASGQAALPSITVAATLAVVGLGLGLLLAWTGWRGLAGLPERPLRLLPAGPVLALFVLAIVLGQVVASAGLVGLWPIFHILAGGLPALLFLSLAVGAAPRRHGGPPARAALGSLAWGGLGGTGLAFFVELLLLVLVAAAVAVWLMASRPDLIQALRNWQIQPPGRGQIPDLTSLLRAASSPWVALAVLLGMGVAAPVIEETAKSLAVPLVALTGRRLSRLDGYLLGVAAGAGFALLEGILNGSVALASAGTWGALMVARGGTAAIHCLATGIMGLAWQSALTDGRWGRAAGLGALGMGLHGIWNTAIAGTLLVALSGQGQAGAAWLAPAVQVFGVLFLGLFWLAAVFALPLIARSLAGAQPPAAPAPVADAAGPDPAG